MRLSRPAHHHLCVTRSDSPSGQQGRRQTDTLPADSARPIVASVKRVAARRPSVSGLCRWGRSRTSASTPLIPVGSKSPCPIKCSTCHSPSSSRSCRSGNPGRARSPVHLGQALAGGPGQRAGQQVLLLLHSSAGSPRGEETTPRIRGGGRTRSGTGTEATGSGAGHPASRAGRRRRGPAAARRSAAHG